MGFNKVKITDYLSLKPEKISGFSNEDASKFLYRVSEDIACLQDIIKELEKQNKSLVAYNYTLKDELKAIQEAKINEGVMSKFWKLLAILGAFVGSVASHIFHRKDNG
jgi:cell division septum initiation protein DivIVA